MSSVAQLRTRVLERHLQPFGSSGVTDGSAAGTTNEESTAGTSAGTPPLGAGAPLSEAEVREFLDRGLLVLPSILESPHIDRLKHTVDAVMADRSAGPSHCTFASPTHFFIQT